MHIKNFFVFSVAVIGIATTPLFAAEAILKGTFALEGVTEEVTAELIVRETGPLTRELLFSFTDKATNQPITQFHEELTQELHVLATDSGFSSFVHEHGGKPELDGRFRTAMSFPKPGTYHVYADAMPAGFGQQVIRFEVPVGITTVATEAQLLPSGGAEGSDGPYTVQFNASTLRVGTESMMELKILKDGKPATDLGLYLGVPAHAVFVSTDDLGYIHAHAMADTPTGGHASHALHSDPKASIPATLMLHATPPRAGQYALWIQFMGSGQVRTVPFYLTIPATL